MSQSNLMFAVAVLVLCLGYSQAAKQCPTMVVSGANDPMFNGNYDVVTSGELTQCHGRDIYRMTANNGSGSIDLWIYFYKYSIISRGWLIGTNPCSNDRSFADIYVWNVNQRPDRGLIGWQELENDGEYRKNRNIDVVCIEGLTYPQIVGIICGCILGVALIAGLTAFFVIKAR